MTPSSTRDRHESVTRGSELTQDLALSGEILLLGRATCVANQDSRPRHGRRLPDSVLELDLAVLRDRDWPNHQVTSQVYAANRGHQRHHDQRCRLHWHQRRGCDHTRTLAIVGDYPNSISTAYVADGDGVSVIPLTPRHRPGVP
jgi:hypothetical protein